MNKIALFSFKGGVGKSTISHLLHKELKLPIYTNDKHSILLMNGIAKDINERKRSDSFILDLGGFSTKQLYSLFTESDIIIVPTLLNSVDLQATVNTLKTLNEFNKKIILVFNRAKKGDSLKIAQAATILSKITDFSPVIVWDSKNIAKIMETDKSISELIQKDRFGGASFKNAKHSIKELLNEIKKDK